MSRLSGKEVLGSFERHVQRYAGEVETLENAIAAKEREIAAANKQREDTYVELAGLYCDEYEHLQKELVSVSRVVQGIFDEKAKRRLTLESEMDRFRQLIARSKEDLIAARETRDAAASERDALVATVEKELAADPAFQALEREYLESVEKGNAEKLASDSLAKEVTAKLTYYEANDLFRYLLKQKYGSSEYRSKGLTARIDGWLALKVAWSTNFVNYSILKDLPDYAERRVGEAKHAMEVLEARTKLRLQECEEKHGLVEARSKYERRCHTVEELEKRLSEVEGQLEIMVKERVALQLNQDPFAKKAKDAIKTTLRGEPIRELRARAERTPDPRDDKLVAVIETAEAAVNKGREEVKRLRGQYNEADKLRARAQKARRQFAGNYTGTYDRFDQSVNVDQLLLGYILGQSNEHTFWSQIGSTHHDETPRYSDSSSSSWSSSSDSSSSSFGGGDSGGGSSFGGGDSGGGSSFGGGD